MAKNPGKRFEQDLISSVPDNIFKHRIKDMGGKYFRVKNICDFLLYKYPILYLLELKTSKGKSIPFSNLAEHQIEGLTKAKELKGIVAGFVINMRDIEETYFIDARIIKEYIDKNIKQYEKTGGKKGRKSIPIKWLRKNGLLIPQEIKITRYTYDITPLIELGEGAE